ncbi:lysylphosphatidylglycerol synthase transmembrane domain-containing protein [Streptomyces stelliscabiei]|uniref:lysylphosphatidylglycerol synthase transmembrane domain-containing protein n=1 Tax=Streptomyces stelliscabiei TaxID=146820 RepID=UPI0029B77CE6|nr:lysylphosphatidylglycerol synthase domain-containing protein [Streptomyces stelliscabiei]MDX2549306.1 lysylphosphatidylglycerol synthase domain-containing protein [Streptomyces stelliscabiei]MDX2611329.1 lysylphosphatidylglycerol synthase domain-containing protein [Streptomyces stelliscabiei]MDX2634576.1 lysylphosphatidylglycerol synthase domain-containing protein [Streptomyces stelliscabiei]MDX2659522.1 lysylphosphatidylglycerol synthase domain-containing protein [Streptomyces stelliscabiei
MKQQSVHPDDAAGTSDASSRPDTPEEGDGGTEGVSNKASETAPPVAETAASGEPEDEEQQVEEGDDPGEAHAEEVEGDEPLLPARVHRPSDLMRLSVGILGIVLLLAIAAFAHGTTSGLEQDINKGTGQAPDLLIKLAGLGSSIAILLVPVAFAIERLIKRDGLRIADGVLAAVLAHGVTLATDLWVARGAPDSIQEALTQPSPGDIHALTDPVHGYLAPVIAYMTAVGMSRRPRWRAVLWIVLLLDAFSMLVTGYTTPFSIILTVLIGWTVAYGTLYAVGSPNVRPTGRTLMAGLRRVGFKPVSAAREEIPDTVEGGDRGRRYFVTLEDGPPLDVTVVDREQQAQGFFYRVWRRLTLRGITTRRSLQSLRQALEQEALLAYAAIAAGANAPKLIATSELGPDAVMLVYEHTGGRTLDSLADDEVTDALMSDTWHQVKALQSRRIAHRRLVGDAVLVDRSGTVILTDLRVGEIAAGDLVLRMDVSQLLTTLGLRVGAERAVASAVSVLGPDAVADCLPLLQPIALSRSTRATLRRLARERAEREREAVLEASHLAKQARAEEHSKAATEPDKADKKAVRAEQRAEKRAIDEALEEAREEDLLTQIRHQVLLIRPQAPVEPARLERVKPRTLISLFAGAIGAYFLLTQLTHIEFGPLIENAEWGWVAAAVFFSALSYVAAAMSLLGFVPERVPFLRTIGAQVAGSFVKIVAPAAVGGVALNTRFLQRAGVRPGLAVASVGASQLFGLGCHILMLLAFGYLTGTEKTPSLSPSRTVIAGLLTVAVLVLVVTSIPFLRKFVVTRVRSLFAGVVPRMLDVLQRPQKLVTGIGGMLLLTGCFVMCLDASIRAFGNEDVSISIASVAVVFLAGNALGSAAPTPGGVGAVEATLTVGLIAVGLPKEVAAPAVLLFRLLTLWLPVLPGWLAFNQLSRKGAL